MSLRETRFAGRGGGAAGAGAGVAGAAADAADGASRGIFADAAAGAAGATATSVGAALRADRNEPTSPVAFSSRTAFINSSTVAVVAMRDARISVISIRVLTLST